MYMGLVGIIIKRVLLFLLSFITTRPRSNEKDKSVDLESQISASVKEFENRKIYNSLDGKVLTSIKDDDLEQAVIDYIHIKIGKNSGKEHQIVTSLPRGFQVVYTTWWVEAEVNNGGYNQYFWNSTGQFSVEAIAGFKEIGATKNATLMENAVQVAIREIDKMSAFKETGTLKAFSESYKHTDLDKLDDEFFKYSEDLSKLRIEYIRNNPLLFTGQ